MAALRTSKSRVMLIGKLNGQDYKESFVVLGRCTDHATQELKDWAAKKFPQLEDVKTRFMDWILNPDNEETPINPPLFSS